MSIGPILKHSNISILDLLAIPIRLLFRLGTSMNRGSLRLVDPHRFYLDKCAQCFQYALCVCGKMNDATDIHFSLSYSLITT
jgi:hypothetical protein